MSDSSTRDKLVIGAAEMLGRQGLNGTSIRELAKHSGTPLGSTYHYFPGGKREFATEAVQFADQLTMRALQKHLPDGPLAGLRTLLSMWRSIVINSDFEAGCPALAVSVQAQPRGEDEPRQAAAAAFNHWIDLLADSLRQHGASDVDATNTATLIVSAVEGTVAICRAQRSIAALDQTEAALEAMVTAVISRPS
ncbi:TetR/AcrR family transcriptional regulator [Gordonia sp. MP11Mi]|uniref:HTH-type transcriptional regulator n=1 Tax=Gordonia sp. MP11Mi TaxID=3022769 RepID=A0AA97CYB1_9ACTN